MSVLKNKITCLLALFIVVINILIGHFCPPSEMLTTIVVLPIITFVVYVFFDVELTYQMLYICFLTVLNDLGQKFFAGGTSDQIGQVLLNLSSISGVFLSYIVLIILTTINRGDIPTQHRHTALILYPLIQIVYFFLCWNVNAMVY